MALVKRILQAIVKADIDQNKLEGVNTAFQGNLECHRACSKDFELARFHCRHCVHKKKIKMICYLVIGEDRKVKISHVKTLPCHHVFP